MGTVGDPQVKYHPLELPANKAAAQAFVDAHPDLVDSAVPMSQERQDTATAAIQAYQDQVATAAGNAQGDPRLGGGTPLTPPVTNSISPTSAGFHTATQVTITGVNLSTAYQVIIEDPCTDVVSTDTTITCTTSGANKKGSVPVEVWVSDEWDNPISTLTFTFH